MRYAAFLRAINVGTNNRIKMAVLKDLCAGAGLTNVTTYLQSGNLVFDFDGDERAACETLEAALTAHGLKNAPAVLRTREELETLMGSDPFEPFPVETHLRYVTLFKEPLPASAAEAAHDLIHFASIRDREVLSAIERGAPQGADVNGFLSKQVKLQGTTRYWHVVGAMAELIARAEPG